MEVDDPQPPSPDISSLKEAAKEIMEKSDGDNKSENGDNKVNGSVMNGDSNGNGNGDSSSGHEDEDGEDSEPLEKGLVGHRAAECPKGAAAIRSQTKGVDVHKVEGVEADQEQRHEVQGESEAVVESVAVGEGLAGLELVQDEVPCTQIEINLRKHKNNNENTI